MALRPARHINRRTQLVTDDTEYTEAAILEGMAAHFDYADQLMKEHGNCTPIFLMQNDGIPVVIPGSWNSHEEHDRFKRVVTFVAHAYNVRCVTMISEVWISGQTDQEPRLAADREEGVVVGTAWRGDDGKRHLITQTRRIKRDKGGVYRGLVERKEDRSPSRVESWLTSAVPEGPVPPNVQAALAKVMPLFGLESKLMDQDGPASVH
jgi:hypothetical protein